MKITVVVSTCDRPEMLREALESVLAQELLPYEVIVVDDGSDTAIDVCADLSDDFAEKSVLIRCANMEYKTGYACAPRNAGVISSLGDHIAYLDDDNIWLPNHLKVLAEGLQESGADIAYSRWEFFGAAEDLPESFPYHQPNRSALRGLMTAPMFNFIDTTSILHKKSSVGEALGPKPWNEEINRFGDWHFAVHCIMAGLAFHGVDEVTFRYRIHDQNISKERPPDAKDLIAVTPEWGGVESVWRG